MVVKIQDERGRSCVSFVAFKEATGSRPLGRGERQPGGWPIPSLSHDLCKINALRRVTWALPVGPLRNFLSSITVHRYLCHITVLIVFIVYVHEVNSKIKSLRKSR